MLDHCVGEDRAAVCGTIVSEMKGGVPAILEMGPVLKKSLVQNSVLLAVTCSTAIPTAL